MHGHSCHKGYTESIDSIQIFPRLMVIFLCVFCLLVCDPRPKENLIMYISFLVPSEGVFGHHRGTDHLRTPGAAAVVAVARHTATRSEQRCTVTALAHLLDIRARPLVQLTLLAVATSHPEHARTVGSGSRHDTNTNANRAGMSRSAAAGTRVRVGVRLAVAIVAAGVAAGPTRAGRSTAARGGARLANHQRNGGINHRHQSVGGAIGLLVKPRVGVVQHLPQRVHLIGGNVPHGDGSDIARALRVVVGLDRQHRHLLSEDLQCILQSERNVKEDLRGRQRRRGHEAVAQLAIESQLNQGRVCWRLDGNVAGRDRPRELGLSGRRRRRGVGGRVLRRRGRRVNQNRRRHPVSGVARRGGLWGWGDLRRYRRLLRRAGLFRACRGHGGGRSGSRCVRRNRVALAGGHVGGLRGADERSRRDRRRQRRTTRAGRRNDTTGRCRNARADDRAGRSRGESLSSRRRSWDDRAGCG
ncbi:hypothetical protein AFLA70_686g000421 [Aspergillus flavus AF70]|nr:hypothetical protein AFLA70_686g000421 [Aspergillus flavus AF70]